MQKRVVLTIESGSFEQGFSIALQIGLEDQLPQVVATGSLPANEALQAHFEQWENSYHGLNLAGRPIGLPKVEIASTRETCESAIAVLRNDLNHWFRQPEASPVRDAWLANLEPSDAIRVILQTEIQIIQRFPWHYWDLLERLPQAEIALGARSFKPLIAPFPSLSPVPILAILGDSQGIDVTADRRALTDLPNANVTFLVEPRRLELTEQLWEQSWPILFFAGHSCSEADGGKLAINPTETLRLRELKFGLQRAVAQGLQLAIFNSCDGLGLARELADLNIPQLIIMREPVPDRVAQAFLKYFLRAYIGGAPLYVAVREARERLQALEDEFPCASGLPMIFQHPTADPPTWQQLIGNRETTHDLSDELMMQMGEQAPASPASSRSPIQTPSSINPEEKDPPISSEDISSEDTSSGNASSGNTPSSGDRKGGDGPSPHRPRSFITGGKCLARTLGTSLAIATTLLGVRHLGWLQPLELKGADQLMQLRQEEGQDSRILVVTVTEADLAIQPDRREDESLSANSLNQLLSILEKHDPRVVGLDIYRQPDRPRPPALSKRFQEQDNLIMTCRVSDTGSEGFPPPTETPTERLGFSDSLPDADDIQRRQLISMGLPANSPCPSPFSLSTMLALQYLGNEDITLSFTEDNQLLLGKRVIPLIQRHRGSYHNIEDWGYQVLVNYRKHKGSLEESVRRLTLEEVLAGQFRPDAIQDRIVLIGTTAPEFGDYSPTPYADATPGVIIQAQMTSQLISAALDDRPLLHMPAWRTDATWVLGAALVGGGLGLGLRLGRFEGRQRLVLTGTTVVGVFMAQTGICLVVLAKSGLWLPWVPMSLALLASAILGFRSHAPPRRSQSSPPLVETRVRLEV